jgi:AraC-like DNA-binding protein
MLTLPGWVEAARCCGFDIQPELAKAGIAFDLLKLESTPVEEHKVKALMAGCVLATRRGHFPFALGQAFGLAYLPELQTLLRSSPSLRGAVQVFEWVRRLINPRLSVRIEEKGELAWLILEFGGVAGNAGIERYFAESMVSAISSAATVLSGSSDWCKRIWFRHRAPAYRAHYGQYLPAAVEFSRPMHALAIERSDLDLPLPGAWPELHHQAHLRLQQRFEDGARTGGLAARVERAMADDPTLVQQGASALAKRLRLHPRTLQRRLRAEGQGFMALRERARMQLASSLLSETALELDAIAERLGFAERRAFTRAFTRWVGMSPTNFRRRK